MKGKEMKRQLLTIIGCAVLFFSVGFPAYAEEVPTEPDSDAVVEEILTEKILIRNMAAKAQSMNVRGIGFFCIF